MTTLTSLPSSTRITTMFRKAMSPIYVNGWVSSWIFENLGFSPFHVDHVVPTQAFSQISLLSCYTRFQHEFCSEILYCQFEGYLGFIPIHQKDNITVGYAIHIGSDSQNCANADDRPPMGPPYVSRTVMDHETKTLLLFKPCAQFDFIAIHAFNGGTRSGQTFIIPFLDYDWDHLPDFPPVMMNDILSSQYMSDTNDALAKFDYSQSDSIQLNNIDLTPTDVQEFMSKVTISQNKHTDSTSNTNEPLPKSVLKSQKSISNALVDTHIPVNRSVEYLSYLSEEQKLSFKNDVLFTLGHRVTNLGNRMDSNDFVIPGFEALMKLRNVHHFFGVPEFHTNVDTSSKFANMYYSAVLSVTADGPLLTRAPSEQIVTCAQGISNQQSNKRHTCQLVQERDRAEILRRRKIRNRLSAHRSNVRKQEHENAIKRELELSKPQIQELKERQTFLLRQNEQLRCLLNGMLNS